MPFLLQPAGFHELLEPNADLARMFSPVRLNVGIADLVEAVRQHQDHPAQLIETPVSVSTGLMSVPVAIMSTVTAMRG
jgi:hypothetical protein